MFFLFPGIHPDKMVFLCTYRAECLYKGSRSPAGLDIKRTADKRDPLLHTAESHAFIRAIDENHLIQLEPNTIVLDIKFHCSILF